MSEDNEIKRLERIVFDLKIVLVGMLFGLAILLNFFAAGPREIKKTKGVSSCFQNGNNSVNFKK